MQFTFRAKYHNQGEREVVVSAASYEVALDRLFHPENSLEQPDSAILLSKGKKKKKPALYV